MNSSAFQLQIPIPCHENWEAMSQQEKGKFCGVCSKTVMDFSRHSKTEILDFMAQNTDQRVCGRVPAKLLDNQASLIPYEQKMQLSKFVFALVLTFGSFLFGYGQENQGEIMGKVAMTPPSQTQTIDTLSLKDSLQGSVSLPVVDTTIILQPEEPMLFGIMIAPVQPFVPEEEIMKKGEIELIAKPEE